MVAGRHAYHQKTHACAAGLEHFQRGCECGVSLQPASAGTDKGVCGFRGEESAGDGFEDEVGWALG